MSGGGSVVSFEMVNALANLGHKVTVLTPDVNWDGRRYDPTINPKIEVIRVPTPSKFNLKVAARRCKKKLENKGEELGIETEFDFIFTIFHPFHLVPNAAVSCAKKLNIPVIIKIDDAIFEKSSGLKSIQRRIEKIYSSRALQNATKILVANQNIKTLIQENYDIQRGEIEIIPNGLDLSLFETSSSERQPTVVFSGVMYYHRGLEVLIDSVPTVLKAIPDAKFVLLGEGPEMNKLKNIAKEKGITSNIEFLGWIDRHEMSKYLSNASVGIGPLKLTSVTANALPIKVLEYMASSLPIIAQKGTLPDDVLVDGDNGYFVEDSKELAKKIIFLLKNPNQVKKMGLKSHKMVQKFSWEIIIKKILDIYKFS